jgi:hypothetical protein
MALGFRAPFGGLNRNPIGDLEFVAGCRHLAVRGREATVVALAALAVRQLCLERGDEYWRE